MFKVNAQFVAFIKQEMSYLWLYCLCLKRETEKERKEGRGHR